MDYNQIMNMSFKFLEDKKKERMAMYVIVALSTGIKVTEILKLRWEDIRKKYININGVDVMFNNNVMRALGIIDKGGKGLIFISQKKTVFSKEHINRSLKVYGEGVTTHTLRKIFGLYYIERHKEKNLALRNLSKHFNHVNVDMTMIYLGMEFKTLDEWDVYNVVDKKEYEIEDLELMDDKISRGVKGIYFLYDKNKSLVYIGKSISCIRERIITHYKRELSKYLGEKEKKDVIKKRSSYKYFSYIEMEDRNEIALKEYEYITKYKPLYNKEFIHKV
jgi:hypothetical protein